MERFITNNKKIGLIAFYNFLALSETWLSAVSSNPICSLACFPSYNFFCTQTGCAGRGVGLIIISSFIFQPFDCYPVSTFEYFAASLQSLQTSILVIYYPPGHPFSTFFNELWELLNCLSFPSLIIFGNFNIPHPSPAFDPFSDLYNLTQHATYPLILRETF